MAVVAPIVSTFDNRGIRQAEKGFGNFSRNVGRQLRNVAIAATGIGVAMGAAVGKAIGAASDLDEAVSATRQIFGDASDAVLAFADSAAEAFGQSKQEALDGALVFGTFGKAAGLAGDELSDFTTGLLGLSSDIASFRNATPEEAIEAIGAALRGESEPLRRFGVLLDDATLKAEALELGIYDGSGALTQQQKILAAEAAIYKQTADAQGDFARTSDGLANSSRILRARMANVTSQIGGAFLPIALKLSGFLLDKVVPAVEKLADTFAEEGLLGVMKLAWGWLKENGPKIGEWALGLAASLIGWIQTNAGPALEKLGEWLGSIGTWIVDTAYPYLQEKVPIWADALWEWVQTDGFDALKKLWEWAGAVGRWITDTAWPWISEKTADWASALWDWVQTDGFDTLAKLWEWAGAVGRWITDTAFPWISEKAGQWADALWEWIETDGVTAIEKLGEWISSIGTWFTDTAGPKLESAAASLVDYVWSWIGSKEFDDETKTSAGDAATAFGKALLTEIGPAMLDIYTGIINTITDTLAGAFKAIGKNLAKDLVSGFTTGDFGVLGLLADWAKKISPTGWFESLFDFIFGGGELPAVPPGVSGSTTSSGGGGGGPVRLARGGIVTKPTFAMIGEGGESEAVIPLSRLGKIGGGDTYNITVNGAVDPVSTARQIRQILEQDQRRLGRLAAV